MRNVTLDDFDGTLIFEEKAEVLLERVKVIDNIINPLEIQWTNVNNKLDPMFRLEYCVFEGIDDISGGIDRVSSFSFTGTNEQIRDDADECALDYKGSSFMKCDSPHSDSGLTFGSISRNADVFRQPLWSP